MPSIERLIAAYEMVRRDLLAERTPSGHWVGELASSALSTATAVSALAIVERHLGDDAQSGGTSQLIVAGLNWLAGRQNPDGGWGDTERSLSNIATTLLVKSAFHLTCVPANHADLLRRADVYLDARGGLAGLRERYGKDKTFAVPILTNAALAGVVAWRDVPALPFELACFPQRWWKRLRLPVVSYAIPALVAIGQAKFLAQPPWNPLWRRLRQAALEPSLSVVEGMQPDSGGFLEATPLTSFVVMSLAGSGRADHPIVRRGVEFLLASARPDGSWPIDTNLATWNTTLAVNALAAAGEDLSTLDCLGWLIECQHTRVHRYTGAAPGGWAWTDLSGGVPDADDTAGALLALAHWSRAADEPLGERIGASAAGGVRWLVDLQNRDGGWPTFCRGWGRLPFDRSGADLTAHVLRALAAWRGRLPQGRELDVAIDAALERALAFLARAQRADGSWLPLWFGNQYQPDESNPVFGTARVVAALRDLGRLENSATLAGLNYLARVQNRDGGWGGNGSASGSAGQSTVEETALATESLLTSGRSDAHQTAASQGLAWLVESVETGRYRTAAPIGLYFAKLWYHEKLYPITFTLAALGQAVRQASASSARPPALRLASSQ